MLAILDDAKAPARRVFRNPGSIITAFTAADIPLALAAISQALGGGRYVAGWLSYELGYALERKLVGRLPVRSDQPLLKMGVYDAPAVAAPTVAGRAYAGPLNPEWAAAAYHQAFDRVRDFIAAGDIYQANLSFRADFAFAGDPYALYDRLLDKSGAAHSAYLDDGERQILSLSPELFFELSRDGAITLRPMKGTAPRRGPDSTARAALLASRKDRAENLMIVDLIRNDVGRIAEIGSVRVENIFEIETYPTLHTMVSTVVAKKRPDAGVAEIVHALFPCGSVTGAPKIRAMEILRELEVSSRGVYCGAIGYFGPAGTATFNVAIRTLTICAGRGRLGIGGGVVQDSNAAGEYAECLLKARFFEADRRRIQLIETLRHENGFWRMESHLARMKESAAIFGLFFDGVKARDALNCAVSDAIAPLRVRLTLDESGQHLASAAPLGALPQSWTYKISPERVQSTDILLRHKTNWREFYDREVARSGSDEVVFLNERGKVTEGARSNVFVARDGKLLTPPLTAGLLAGRLRAELIAQGKAMEATLFPDDLKDGLFFGNSLRGLIPGVPAA